MQVPLKMTFQDIPTSPSVEARIRERAEALEKFFPGIVSCHVSVELGARRHQKGRM
jgi:Sigma 54 modulation protein / S30EA ribosomal protein